MVKIRKALLALARRKLGAPTYKTIRATQLYPTDKRSVHVNGASLENSAMLAWTLRNDTLPATTMAEQQ